MVIYLSAPVFGQHERRWNREIAGRLSEAMPGSEVILPQDFKVKGRYNDKKNLRVIFQRCVEGIRRADVIVAGSLILGAVMDHYGQDAVTVWDRGLRWGLLHAFAPAA